ncbi:MAG: 2-oxoacid:acceptor oxidoreductase subunit alpha [Bacteriovoracaceae bacterium]|nr:2-oxoacid:acceptor oxidoreductase subunit alpha [Bacteriovoracaceae bacterium]
MKDVDSVVIRFSGDSGDGMQLTGTQFSNTVSRYGADVSTFPDFPSEIRAPQGTIAGVSGFQVNFGSTEILTPGDAPDILVAMNPAALKANCKDLKEGGLILINTDAFDKKNLMKAGYKDNPLEGDDLNNYRPIKVDMTARTLAATKHLGIESRFRARCKNFFALGVTFHMFDLPPDYCISWIEKKFKTSPLIVQANICALNAGREFATTVETLVPKKLVPADITPGHYRQVNGNIATALGLMQAAEASDLKLFLGSYPITPATDILHELSKYKEFEVITFQAEDEIAGICSAIGASFAGALGITTTSGPGLALKGEAIGLATIYEIPLVIVNVQRGGPSTGLPTKTEQSDLNQALYGRNGECPVVVIAASRPSDCFHMAYEAARITLEHMTPVILLTDGLIANGAEPWKIPDFTKEYTKIKTKLVDKECQTGDCKFMPYERDPETLVRKWTVPGMKGYEHRIGGLEKQDVVGSVSHNPLNHQVMTDLRQKKVDLVANNIPLQEVVGEQTGDLLVVSWGGSYGANVTAVKEVQKQGKKVSLAHLRYINPMPKNFHDLLKGFKKILVPELNMGQLKDLLNTKFQCGARGYNKVQGLPFKVSEVIDAINKELGTI